ncbi:MAG: hypothetical protein ACD_7C00050G0001, partial [uncultured bacterium]
PEAAFSWALYLASDHVIGSSYDKKIFELVQKSFVFQSASFKRSLSYQPASQEINKAYLEIEKQLVPIGKELSKRVTANNPRCCLFDFRQESDNYLKDPYLRAAALIQRFIASRDILNAVKTLTIFYRTDIESSQNLFHRNILDTIKCLDSKYLTFVQYPFTPNELKLYKLFKNNGAL